MNSLELKKKFEKLSKSIQKNQWKYFHRESINNFLNKIDSIKKESDRNRMLEIFDSYLNDVEINFEPTADYSIYLFNTYLKFVVPIYRNQLKFTAVPSKKLLFFLGFLVALIFIFLLKYLLFEFIFMSLILLISIDSFIKYKKDRVYGFRY